MTVLTVIDIGLASPKFQRTSDMFMFIKIV